MSDYEPVDTWALEASSREWVRDKLCEAQVEIKRLRVTFISPALRREAAVKIEQLDNELRRIDFDGLDRRVEQRRSISDRRSPQRRYRSDGPMNYKRRSYIERRQS